MLTYDEWSEALAGDAIAGAARGEAIFLSVDEYTLGRAARAYCREHPQIILPTNAVADFTSTVRARVVRTGRVELSDLAGQTAGGVPRAVTFLGAMVRAATRMAETEEMDETNYFRRLREVLDLPAEPGRPKGLETGVEQPLWQAWNTWLLERQLLPSARGGEGSRKFVGYPISQALLRDADRDRLRRQFQEHGWREPWDPDRLLSRVRGMTAGLGKHLSGLLAERGGRMQALAEAIAEVYDEWRRSPVTATGARENGRALDQDDTGMIRAGLYRVEDPIFGETCYHIYPREPRRWHAVDAVVDQAGRQHPLRQERPGWFGPLDAVTEGDLEHGARFPLSGVAGAAALLLPARDFWLLQPDPDDPEYGNYATWGPPPLGMPFILLYRTALQEQLDQLRSEGLFRWDGEPVPVFEGWAELHGCMAVSEAWSSTFIESEDLWDALRPATATLTITAVGGLRVAKPPAWLAEFGPAITVRGFDQDVDVEVFRVGASTAMAPPLKQRTGVQFTPAWEKFGPGDYLVQASAAGQFGQRLVRITTWAALTAADLDTDAANTAALAFPGGQVRGALVTSQSEDTP